MPQENRREFLKDAGGILVGGSAGLFLPGNEETEAAISSQELEQSRILYTFRLPNGTTITYRILGARDALQDGNGIVVVANDGVFGAGLKFSHSEIQKWLQKYGIAVIAVSKYEGTSWRCARNSMQWAAQVKQLTDSLVSDHDRKLAILGYSAGGLDAVALSILLGNRASVCAVLAGVGDLADPANFHSLGERRQKELNMLRGLGVRANPRTPRIPVGRKIVERVRDRIRERAEEVLGQKVSNPSKALKEWLTHVTESDRRLVRDPEMSRLMLQEFKIYDKWKALDTFHSLFNRGVDFGETPKETIYYVRNGLEDTLVPPSHSRRTAESLKVRGRKVLLEFVPGGHAEVMANYEDFIGTFMELHQRAA